MKNPEIAEAFRCLGLAPAASLEQVEDAYQRKTTLYGEHSLATYALLDAEERQDKLTRLKEAYARICAVQDGADRQLPFAGEAKAQAQAQEESAAVPDPAACPGGFLRAHRLQAGLTLREIADRTKIGSMKLAQIEEEQFHALPAPVYLRGFVLAFARTLGLPDPEGISRLFLARQQEQTAEFRAPSE
jgi:hypothetical protein